MADAAAGPGSAAFYRHYGNFGSSRGGLPAACKALRPWCSVGAGGLSVHDEKCHDQSRSGSLLRMSMQFKCRPDLCARPPCPLTHTSTTTIVGRTISSRSRLLHGRNGSRRSSTRAGSPLHRLRQRVAWRLRIPLCRSAQILPCRSISLGFSEPRSSCCMLARSAHFSRNATACIRGKMYAFEP